MKGFLSIVGLSTAAVTFANPLIPGKNGREYSACVEPVLSNAHKDAAVVAREAGTMGMDANIFRPLQRRRLDSRSDNSAALLLGQLAQIDASGGASNNLLAKRQDASDGARLVLGQLVAIDAKDEILTTMKKVRRQGEQLLDEINTQTYHAQGN
jgi:hypothetical protein